VTYIRRIASEDIPACVGLGVEAYRSVFASYRHEYGDELFARMRPDWENAQGALIEDTCSAAEGHTWVADIDGEVAGFVSTTMAEATGLGDIGLIAVHPQRQRRGVGEALNQHALIEMRNAGIAYATAYTRDHPGHLPAQNVLKRAGFAPMGIQPQTLITALRDPLLPNPAANEIRPICDSDLADCVRFGIEAFRPVFASFESMYGKDLFDRLRPDWERAQSAYIETVCTNKDALVAVIDGAASGFVVMERDVFDGIGAIELLAVNPQFGNRGVGTLLNHSALSWLQDAGMAYAVVSTGNDPSHAPARRSYEKAGFELAPVQWNLMVARVS
jgi:ribosomal protein S18 acetylase RimI-like enzyme